MRRHRMLGCRVAGVMLLVAALVGLAPPAPSEAAEEFSGAVDSAGTLSQEHVVQHTSPGRLDAVLTWEGPAVLRLEVRGLDGQVVAADAEGPSPRSIGAVLPRDAYRLVVTAVSGAATYTLRTRDGGDPAAWAGAVASAGTATRSHPLPVAQEGVLAATLTWESSTALAAPPATLRLAVSDGTGRVVAEAEGPASPLTLETPVTAGDLTLQVTAVSGGATFEVRTEVHSELTAPDRVEAAYEEGEVSAGDAARYSLWAALEPQRVPSAYQAPAGTEPQDELAALRYWDELTPAEREDLAAYLTPVERPSQRSAVAAPAAAPWIDCGGGTVFEVFLTNFACVASADGDGDGEDDFEVIYNVEGASSVDDEDDEAPIGRPDQVDLTIESMTDAWRHYEALGFRPISAKLRVVLWSGMVDGAGLSLPRFDDGGDGEVTRQIYMDTGFERFLPRHELFHQFQYEYVGALDLGVLGRSGTWWMEATANWAAHEAQAMETEKVRRSPDYALELAQVLGQPERRWDDTSRWSGGAEYGSFILAEYLDERFDGPSTIAQTWERIDNGVLLPPRFPAGVVEHLLEEDGDGFATEVQRFRQWSYVLTGVPAGGGDNFGIGFTDEGEADGVDDVAEFWRPVLQDDPRTAGVTAATARPRRQELILVPGAAALDGAVTLQQTGAAYVDLDLPGGDRELRVTLRNPDDDILASVLPFSAYPRLCAPPVPVPQGGAGDDTLIWAVPEGCTSATLVLTKAAPGSDDVGGVSWSAASVVPPGGTYRFPDGVADVFWTREGEFTSGNVNNRVDLAEHTAAYGPQVTLALRPLDAAPLDALNAIEWLLDTNANGSYDHYVSWVPPMGVADPPWFVKVFRNATPNDVLQCEVPLTFDGTFYRASFAPSCLGSPAQVGVVARFWGDSPEPTGLNVDVAPDTGFSGPVPRPAGAADALRAEGVAPAPVERRLPSAGTPPAAPEERARP